jgi:RNA polymerase sigma-70 factor (ECF subfamily)
MYASAALDAARPMTGEPPPVVVAESAPVFAFETFYREVRPTIGRALALALGDADIAAEATDEAMTRAYERWSTVGTLDRPEAWVYRVASNWALSIFRRRKLSLHKLYTPAAVDATTAAIDPSVHAAVAALDVKHRSVVVCRHLLGWTVAETAEALGINEGTVKSRLHRANQMLRVRLQDITAPVEQS